MSQPPKSDVIRQSWHECEAKLLKAAGSDPAPESRNFARAAFYLGCLSMLEMMEAIHQQARGVQAEIAADQLRQEILTFIERRAAARAPARQ